MFQKLTIFAAILLFSIGCSVQAPPPGKPVEPPVVLPQNAPPTIKTIKSANRISALATSEIACEAEDPDGDELAYSWSCSSGTIVGQGSVVNWTAPAAVGDYTIAVSVDDTKGGVTRQSVTITVTDKPNQPPVITELSVWLPKSAGEMKIDPSVELYERPRMTIRILASVLIHCRAQDPDGDQMTYSWTATEGQITDEDGPKIIWTAPTNPIRQIVTVTVTDERGASSTAKLAFDVSCCK